MTRKLRHQAADDLRMVLREYKRHTGRAYPPSLQRLGQWLTRDNQQKTTPSAPNPHE